MKRYIVAVTGLTDDEEKSFIEFVRAKKMGWWHRIANFWLLTDETEKSSAAEIRSFLMDLDSSRIGFVIENPDHETWAGFAAEDRVKETFAWLHRNWKKQ